MKPTGTEDKDIRHPVGKPRAIKELFKAGGSRLATLEATSRARSQALAEVHAALPGALGDAVVSAGVDGDCLTLGVSSAVWAARLRYSTEVLRSHLGSVLGVPIERVRIKVVPPG